MPKVHVSSQIELDLDAVLQGIAQLQTRDLERFADEIITLRAARRAPRLPRNEADLLQKINSGVSPSVRRRHAELNTKVLEESITSEELQEFLGITDQIEAADAERLLNLVALAQLRNISVDTLMDQLGIRRSVNV